MSDYETIQEYGYNCLNCETYGVWSDNQDRLLIPCVNCARSGGKSKENDKL